MELLENFFLKGVEIPINLDTKLLGKLYKHNLSYYMTFTKLIDLSVLRDIILKYVLNGQNEVKAFRYKGNKIKETRPLRWNCHENTLNFYEPSGLFTLQITRSGFRIFPHCSDYETNLNKSIEFILNLELAGFIEVAK